MNREDGVLVRFAVGFLALLLWCMFLLLVILIDLAVNPYERIRLAVELAAIAFVTGFAVAQWIERKRRQDRC